MSLLVVVAVEAEATAVTRALGPVDDVAIGPLPARRVRTGAGTVDVLAAGIGPVAAAAATATALSAGRYDTVLSAGIAGGFAGVAIGDVVVADRICFADLGAHSPQGFLHHAELGWRVPVLDPSPVVVAALRDRLLAAGLPTVVGAVLTVASVTGTQARAGELTAAHTPRAEAMEGAGVAHAAQLFGIRAAELRTISNAVGDRDTSAWDFPAALGALSRAAAAVLVAELPT